MRPGEGPTPFRGRRQSARVVDSRRYRALAGRTACVCAAERGSREEMGRYAIPVSSLRPREIDNVKGRSSTRAQCCWRALPILWVRVDGAKTARKNAPSSLATDGWGWKRCRSLFTNLHRSWSRRNCSTSALKCGASYCARFEQTERERANQSWDHQQELFADMKIYVDMSPWRLVMQWLIARPSSLETLSRFKAADSEARR